jgi:hypothetical protein
LNASFGLGVLTGILLAYLPLLLLLVVGRLVAAKYDRPSSDRSS